MSPAASLKSGQSNRKRNSEKSNDEGQVTKGGIAALYLFR